MSLSSSVVAQKLAVRYRYDMKVILLVIVGFSGFDDIINISFKKLLASIQMSRGKYFTGGSHVGVSSYLKRWYLVGFAE